MRLKLLSLFILCFCIMMPASIAFAGDNDNNNTAILKKKRDNPINPHRPKKPSCMYITMDYRGGKFYFTHSSNIDYFEITLHNLHSGEYFIGEYSIENPVWEVIVPTGEYFVTCATDTEEMYEGYIQIII